LYLPLWEILKYSLPAPICLLAVSGFGDHGLIAFFLRQVRHRPALAFFRRFGGLGGLYDLFTPARQVQEANILYETKRALESGAAAEAILRYPGIRYPIPRLPKRQFCGSPGKNAGLVTPGE
jgi:hypothetical protein